MHIPFIIVLGGHFELENLIHFTLFPGKMIGGRWGKKREFLPPRRELGVKEGKWGQKEEVSLPKEGDLTCMSFDCVWNIYTTNDGWADTPINTWIPHLYYGVYSLRYFANGKQLHELLYAVRYVLTCGYDVFVRYQIIKLFRTVLFYPAKITRYSIMQ